MAEWLPAPSHLPCPFYLIHLWISCWKPLVFMIFSSRYTLISVYLNIWCGVLWRFGRRLTGGWDIPRSCYQVEWRRWLGHLILIHHLISLSPWRFWYVHSYMPLVRAGHLAPRKIRAVVYPMLKVVRFVSSCSVLFSPWTFKRWFFNLAPWLGQQAYLYGKRGAVKMLSTLWLFLEIEIWGT